METILEELIRNLPAIIAGVPLKWENVPRESQRAVTICALHCCLNGPVGVNKRTTFPIIGEATIKDLVKTSNSSWRGFCEVIAKYLVDKNVSIECNSLRTLKTFWPLVDWPKKVV